MAPAFPSSAVSLIYSTGLRLGFLKNSKSLTNVVSRTFSRVNFHYRTYHRPSTSLTIPFNHASRLVYGQSRPLAVPVGLKSGGVLECKPSFTVHCREYSNRNPLLSHIYKNDLSYAPKYSPCLLCGRRDYSRGFRHVTQEINDMDPRNVSGSSAAARTITEEYKQDIAAWTLRTSVENVYLSWVRNTYILTVAGVTMYSQVTIPLAEEAAVLILFSGAINLTTGTCMYIYNLMTLRKRLQMSRMGLVTFGSLSSMHVLFWLAAMMIYLGYIEDDVDIEDEIRKEEEITKARRKMKQNRKRYD